MNNIVTGTFPDVYGGTANADPCDSFEAAMRLLDRRWAGAVVRALQVGAHRFGEIRDHVPGITDAVLSSRLRELCAWGLATREYAVDRPRRVRYRLTDAGLDLEPVLRAIEDYGDRHRQLLQQVPRRRS